MQCLFLLSRGKVGGRLEWCFAVRLALDAAKVMRKRT